MTPIEQLFFDINAAIADRIVEAGVVGTSVVAVTSAESSLVQTLQRATMQNGALIEATGFSNSAKSSLGELVFDVEIAARTGWALKSFGLDLNAIIPTTVTAVTQTGAAQIAFVPHQNCHPLANGEWGLEVPISVNAISLQFTTWVNLGMHHEGGTAFSFLVRPSSEVMTCPSDILNGRQHSELRKQFASNVDLEHQFLVPALEFGVIPKPVFLLALTEIGDGTLANSGLRFLGQTRRRGRVRRAYLDLNTFPSWADVAFRLGLNVLLDLLHNQLDQYGATIIAGPTFPSNQNLSLTARLETSASVHIGCIEVGVHVWVDVDLLATVKTNGVDEFWFEVRQDGPPRQGSDVNPDILVDWLLEQLINAILGRLALLLPAVDITSDKVPFPGSTALSATLTNEGITIYTKQH